MTNIVVFTQRVEIVESYGERRDCADQRIAQFIKEAGFIPIPLPNDAELAEVIVNTIKPKGIVLTGGNSLEAYGGNAPERDCLDKKLLQISIDKTIPLFGFCRGMQSVLDFFGEKLEEVSNHVAKSHEISGQINRSVNSFHNQGCKALKDDTQLVILAKTKDGVIEAVRHKEYMICGIMWHPEREHPFFEIDTAMMKSIFNRED